MITMQITLFAEFLAATLEAHGYIEEERVAAAFDRLDSDDSGTYRTSPFYVIGLLLAVVKGPFVDCQGSSLARICESCSVKSARRKKSTKSFEA